MNANPEPRPGDWFVTTISGPGGGLVGLGEAWADSVTLHKLSEAERRLAQDWRHAGMFLGDGSVLQAEPHGAEIVSWTPVAGTLISTGLWPEADPELVTHVAADRTGTPYSWADYAQLAAHRMGMDWEWLRAEIKATGHMMCSMLLDRCQLDMGVHLFEDGRWEGDVMPLDLGLLLASKGAHSWV